MLHRRLNNLASDLRSAVYCIHCWFVAIGDRSVRRILWAWLLTMDLGLTLRLLASFWTCNRFGSCKRTRSCVFSEQTWYGIQIRYYCHSCLFFCAFDSILLSPLYILYDNDITRFIRLCITMHILQTHGSCIIILRFQKRKKWCIMHVLL